MSDYPIITTKLSDLISDEESDSESANAPCMQFQLGFTESSSKTIEYIEDLKQQSKELSDQEQIPSGDLPDHIHISQDSINSLGIGESDGHIIAVDGQDSVNIVGVEGSDEKITVDLNHNKPVSDKTISVGNLKEINISQDSIDNLGIGIESNDKLQDFSQESKDLDAHETTQSTVDLKQTIYSQDSIDTVSNTVGEYVENSTVDGQYSIDAKAENSSKTHKDLKQQNKELAGQKQTTSENLTQVHVNQNFAYTLEFDESGETSTVVVNQNQKTTSTRDLKEINNSQDSIDFLSVDERDDKNNVNDQHSVDTTVEVDRSDNKLDDLKEQNKENAGEKTVSEDLKEINITEDSIGDTIDVEEYDEACSVDVEDFGKQDQEIQKTILKEIKFTEDSIDDTAFVEDSSEACSVDVEDSSKQDQEIQKTISNDFKDIKTSEDSTDTDYTCEENILDVQDLVEATEKTVEGIQDLEQQIKEADSQKPTALGDLKENHSGQISNDRKENISDEQDSIESTDKTAKDTKDLEEQSKEADSEELTPLGDLKEKHSGQNSVHTVYVSEENISDEQDPIKTTDKTVEDIEDLGQQSKEADSEEPTAPGDLKEKHSGQNSIDTTSTDLKENCINQESIDDFGVGESGVNNTAYIKDNLIATTTGVDGPDDNIAVDFRDSIVTSTGGVAKHNTVDNNYLGINEDKTNIHKDNHNQSEDNMSKRFGLLFQKGGVRTKSSSKDRASESSRAKTEPVLPHLKSGVSLKPDYEESSFIEVEEDDLFAEYIKKSGSDSSKLDQSASTSTSDESELGARADPVGQSSDSSMANAITETRLENNHFDKDEKANEPLHVKGTEKSDSEQTCANSEVNGGATSKTPGANLEVNDADTSKTPGANSEVSDAETSKTPGANSEVNNAETSKTSGQSEDTNTSEDAQTDATNKDEPSTKDSKDDDGDVDVQHKRPLMKRQERAKSLGSSHPMNSKDNGSETSLKEHTEQSKLLQSTCNVWVLRNIQKAVLFFYFNNTAYLLVEQL